MTRLRSLLRPLPLALVWTGALLVALFIPADTLPPTNPALSLDKLVHVGLFGVLGGLWLRVAVPFRASRRRHIAGGLLVLGGGTLFAVATEACQYLMPIRRHGDPYDALANVVGLLCALAVYAAVVRRCRPARSASTAPEAPGASEPNAANGA